MLARFREDVLLLYPKAVVILAGTNDIAAGIALNQTEDNLSIMGDIAKAHGIKPIFASVLPVSDYHKDVDPRYEVTKSRPLATIRCSIAGYRAIARAKAWAISITTRQWSTRRVN